MINLRNRNAGVQVYGMTADNLASLPRIADPATSLGDISRYGEGVAIGSGVARELGAQVGDRIKLISPNVSSRCKAATKDAMLPFISTAPRP